ncbi:MAG TPA: M20 family peptidase [Candidatus Korarchaeota archaeon]|nr:M20 family peptidase [Candidatus Korarchaeota archaeon]
MRIGVLDLASSLISIDSTNPGKLELEIADFLGDVLEDLGFNVERQRYSMRMNLFAYRNQERVRLLFCGHLDTVPPTEGWERSPFSPKVMRGRLFGLGACDMKGAIAAMIAAGVEALAEDKEVGVGFLLTSDEEVGMSGAKFAAPKLRDLFKNLRLCLIGEPTDLRLVTCHKGVLRATLRVKGVASHSSIPERGVNAVHIGINVLKRMMERGIPQLAHPILGRPTLQVTWVRGGVAENIIPDSFEAKIDARLIPQETEDRRKLLMDIAGEWGERVELEFGLALPPYEAPEIPEIAAISRIMGTVGLDSRPFGVPYLTEASVYWEKGIPSVIVGPGDIEQAHRPNESVYITKLALAKKLYRSLVLLLNRG